MNVWIVLLYVFLTMLCLRMCASAVTAPPLVSSQDHDYLNSRKRGISKRLSRDLPLVKLLNISITLSPFLGVDTTQFHASLIDGTEDYWLSLPSAPQGQLVRSGCGGSQPSACHMVIVIRCCSRWIQNIT